MEFKELKKKFRTTWDMVLKNHDYYNNTVMHINKENYIFRCVLNHSSSIDFELIKPNKDYFKIHPFFGVDDVKFTFIIHPMNCAIAHPASCTKTTSHEVVKSIDKFCEILGWDESNLKEFGSYLDMYNLKRV